MSSRSVEFPSPWITPETVVLFPSGGRERLEFEVAIVNDSAEPLPGVGLILTFWRRKGSERRNVLERALSWDRELAPGRSVKWRVRARGNALRVTPYVAPATSDEGYAPADAFVGLASSGLSAVRLHAVTMLAYLGDERAPALARSLVPLTPKEEEARGRLLETFAPLIACDVIDGKACVTNRTSQLVRGVAVNDRSGRSVEVKDLLFPRRGLRIPVDALLSPLRVTPLEPVGP